jgi:nucleotide-binding universal stress UspA family protein
MYQKIMVPLDGSELAECVLPHVEAISKGCKVKDVVLVRVVEPLEFQPDTYIAFSGDELLRIESGRKSEAEEYLKKATKQLQESVIRVRSEVLSGKAAESLAEYASKNGVDLIVIATHGRSGISHWYWGSVAERILRFTCVPVLMVRAPGCSPEI